MTLLRKYYSPGIEGGGIPDEVIKMLEEKFRLPTEKELGDFESIEDAVSHMATQNLCFAMSKYGYSLALPELTAKEEEIAKLKEEVERGGWISVEDRLPEKNGYYTTWCKDPYEHGLIHYNKETGWQNSFYNERVTHWKLLIPPPPKSK